MNERDAIQLLGSGAKMGVSYHNISNAGIPLTTEPFFKSLLVAMYRHDMHELLAKGRIRLPPAEARLMMGVMDELGVLKPGQVSFFYFLFCKLYFSSLLTAYLSLVQRSLPKYNPTITAVFNEWSLKTDF